MFSGGIHWAKMVNGLGVGQRIEKLNPTSGKGQTLYPYSPNGLTSYIFNRFEVSVALKHKIFY